MQMSKLCTLLFLLLLVPGMAVGQWKTTRTYRGPGAPATNMCQDAYDLGIVYTDYTHGGKMYVCQITLAGTYEWHSSVVADPTGNVTMDTTVLPGTAIATTALTTVNLVAGNNGQQIAFTAGTDVTLNLTSAVAVKGFSILIIQRGAGSVIPTASGAGIVIRQREGKTKTAGQYAMATLSCDIAGDCILGGDLQ